MEFSGSRQLRRADLLAVVSALDVETVLARAAVVGAERTGAGAVVLALVDEDPAGERLDAGAEEGPQLTVHGIDQAAARAVRARLGEAGLRGTPGERPEHDVVRLRDPADGTEVLRVPVLAAGRLLADLLLLGPPGGEFADDAVDAVSVLATLTAVAVRNARGHLLNERRREAAQLAAAVDQSVRAPFVVTETVELIAEGARRISRARTALVATAVSQGVEVSAAAGDELDDLDGLLGDLADLVRNAQDDGREFVVRVGTRAVWGVPLSADHALAGVVVLVLDPVRSRLSPVERGLLVSFVRHGSLVLDHGALQQERQHAVLAADRDRIARDLHDIVIQRLYATALRLRAGARAERHGHGDGEHVTEAIREIGDSIREIRGTIFELERGRSASLRSDALALAREYESALGFTPVVRTWGAVDSMVGQELAEQATVVLREMLSNCARHAGAGRCEVDLSVEAGSFVLQVCDDGRGMPEGEVPHSGLRNVRSRAQARGGELVVEPAQPRGTLLRWRVPLEPQGAGGRSTGSSSALTGTGEG